MSVSRRDFFALGWMYGKLCKLLDDGIDPRNVEVPALMEEFVQVAEDQDKKDQKESAREQLMYYVNNPSAWDHFDQHLSDLIWQSIDPMPEEEETKPVERGPGYFWVIPEDSDQWEIAKYDRDSFGLKGWYRFENGDSIFSDHYFDIIGDLVAKIPKD